MTMTDSEISSRASTPRYGTKRNPSRKSRGAEVAAIAQLLGQPLLPWQRLVADVALEVHPDGRPVYRTVIVQVPRQAGKTTLALSVMVHRSLRWGIPQNVVYTAQTGHHARTKFRNDQLPLLETSQIRQAIEKVYLGAGLESLIFKNGSRIMPLGSTANALHGKTLDLVFLDEARFDKTSDREAGALPAMATRRDAQLWIISTAGDVESVFFREKVEQGRAAVEDGIDEGICYFEYSAGDDDDLEDPATWWQMHPALGHLITEDTIRHAKQTLSRDQFAQEYGNRWSAAAVTLIEPAAWQKLQDKKAAPDGELSFCLDVALDRSSACIAVSDKAGRLEVIDHRPGVQWVAARCQQLTRRHRAPVIVDGYGPAGTLLEPLEALGVNVVRYTTRDVCNAVGLFYDAINAGTIKVRPNESLDIAAAGVRKKIMASAWLWARADLDTDITPLYAVTLAWHHATQKKETPKPRSFVY
jgi:hypothetical protein